MSGTALERGGPATGGLPDAFRAMNPGSRAGLAVQRTALRLAASGPLRSLFNRSMRPPSDAVVLPEYDGPEVVRR